MSTRVFQYVPHDMVPEYECNGWVFVRMLMGHHGLYCALMEKNDE